MRKNSLIHCTSLPEKVKSKKFSDNPLLNILKEQKDMQLKGGIYHRTQVDLTYNSNRIEGNKLTQEQTRFIFETNNHFRCIDLIIEKAKTKLTEPFIKELDFILKSGTSDSRKDWFRVGEYKKRSNEVGGMGTCLM